MVACDKVCIDSHEQVKDTVLRGNEEAVARHLIASHRACISFSGEFQTEESSEGGGTRC